MAPSNKDNDSLLDALRKLTEQVAGGTFDFARNTATLTAMFGESWLRNILVNRMEPERLEAMADAGRFLRDARETAGMSVMDLADSLGLSDRAVLENIESGETIMPLELMLRSAALLARHDPIPFLIKFMRTYNPALEKTLEQWGIMALPRQYERERRFVNLMRQHDELRSLSDAEYDRFIHYMESSSHLVLGVMEKEKKARRTTPRKASASRGDRQPTAKRGTASRLKTKRVPAKKKAAPKRGKRAVSRRK
ncbi:MAG: helix-turn-helix transcriptional regulator [Halioglobus sp.]|nr:helix-turn-helix transcriptional regulator [Halioglobus sp.]